MIWESVFGYCTGNICNIIELRRRHRILIHIKGVPHTLFLIIAQKWEGDKFAGVAGAHRGAVVVDRTAGLVSQGLIFRIDFEDIGLGCEEFDI